MAGVFRHQHFHRYYSRPTRLLGTAAGPQPTPVPWVPRIVMYVSTISVLHALIILLALVL